MPEDPMQRQAIAGTLCVLALTVGALGAAHEESAAIPAGRIHWHTDLESARIMARATNRPLLLVFDNPRCEHSRRLHVVTLSHPQMVDYIERRFVPVRLDLETGAHAAQVLGVSALPTSIVMSPQADLLGRIVGYVDGHRYYAVLAASRRLQQRIELEESAPLGITPHLPAHSPRIP
jgi:thioredoxin-related protein